MDNQQTELLIKVQSAINVLVQFAQNTTNTTVKKESDILFSDYFDRYLESIKTDSQTFGGKINFAQHIIDELGDYKMHELDKSTIRQFLNNFANKTYTQGKCAPKHYSQSAINKVFDLLHDVIRDASNEDGDKLIRTDFMINLEKPRSKQHKPEKEQILTDEELRKIFRALSNNKMLLCWVHIMADTGVRPSEALALRFSDIDFENRTIKIYRTLSKTADYDVKSKKKISAFRPIIKDLKNEKANHKQNYQRRVLSVSAATIDALICWKTAIENNREFMANKKSNGTEEYLFCGSSGQFWLYEDYKQQYERLLNQYGLDGKSLNPYRYRHTVCTDLLRQKVDIKTVQLVLGDNTPDMVLKVYANMNNDDILRGGQVRADRMDDLFKIG